MPNATRENVSAEPAPRPAERPAGAAPAPGARALRVAAIVVLLVALFGLAARLYLIANGLAVPRRPPPYTIFYRLFALHEATFLWMLAAAAAATLWAVLRDAAWRLPAAAERAAERARALPLWLLALVVVAITGLGTELVMHGIGLSMDEYAATFQARIFGAGHLTAKIPAAWQPLAPWMTPIFVTYKPDEQLWVATYLPVYAAMRALMSLLRAEWLTNPLLAGATVLLLDAAARRLWPEGDRRRWIALALLVTSAQFLATSMSGYSMPAHLCLNLLWLWLFLRDDRASLLLLPWVGVVAMGLHNPFPHALFVAPFLLRLVRDRRIGWTAYFGAVYLVGAAVWLRWLAFAAPPATAGAGGGMAGGLLASFRLPDATMRFTHGVNLSLLFSWQTPLFGVLLLLALFSWRRLARTERDLAAGLLLTLGFYLLFPQNQGHGWGYRYAYGALGNAMLLAATGATLLARVVRAETARTLLATSLAASVIVQWPVRALQTEEFVRPFARAMEFIGERPRPVVAVDWQAGWYATDLVRNDPLFERGPAVFGFMPGYGPGPDRVPPHLRDSVMVFSRTTMSRLGYPLLPPRR